MKKLSWNFIFSFLFIFSPTIFAETLELPEALRRLETHKTRTRDKLDIKRQEWLKNAEWMNLSPRLSVTRSFADLSMGNAEVNSLNFNASLNLFNGFNDYSGIRQQSAGLDQSIYNEADLLLQARLSVTELFLRCIFNKKNVAEADSALKMRNQLAQVANVRYKRGTSSMDDYLKLKIDAETAASDLLLRRQIEANCYRSLTYWVGNFTALKYEFPPSATELKKTTWTPQEHPRVQAAAAEVTASQWQKNAQWSNYYPSVNLSFENEPEFQEQNSAHVFMLSASWSLLDGGQDWTSLQRAKIAETQAELMLKDQINQISRNEENAFNTFKTSLEQHTIAERSYGLAQKLLSSSSRRYRSGAISANEVALDQTRVINTSFTLNNIWLERNLNYYRWLYSRAIN